MPNQLCRNCGQNIVANYCPNCGQKCDTDRLTWSSLGDGFVSSFIGNDAFGERGHNARMGFFGTWWNTLIRPVRTVGEFLAGRRVRFFNPVGLLLLLASAHAMILYATGQAPAEAPLEAYEQWYVRFLRLTIEYVSSHPAVTQFMLMPFMALAAKHILRRRSDLNYVEYVYLFVFVGIFQVTVSCIGILWAPARSYLLLATLYLIYVGNLIRGLFGTTRKGALLRVVRIFLRAWIYCILTAALLLALLVLLAAWLEPQLWAEIIS